jgi:hypothetical protein
MAAVAAMSAMATVAASARAANPYPQLAGLTASDGGANDRLGFYSRAVSISGTTVVAGAPYHEVGSNVQQGAAYVFTGATGNWTQAAELTANDGQAEDNFGESVAISGSTVVVGAPDHAVGGTFEAGAAYVFSNVSGSWKQVAELVPSDGAASDTFGDAVAITGNTIVVGAPGHGGYTNGAVYLFTLQGGTWTQTAELTGSPQSGAIGALVAASGPTIVTANGENVRVYSGLSGTPAAVADIAEPQVTALAISGSTIVAGGSQTNDSMGSAYVITNAGGTWTQTQVLTPWQAVTPADPGDFGVSVGISGNTIAVGAPTNTVGSTAIQGSVFVFTKSNGASFTPATTFIATGNSPEWTGSGLGLAGGLIAVGAGDTKVGSNGFQGEVYMFGTPSTQEVSGTVRGTQCTDTSCTVPGGIGGFRVLVKGTASDGSPVSVIDTSANDGTWSVQVPAGSYTAGLSRDGASFVSDAMEQPVKVSNADVGDVNFTSCAGPTTAGAARDLAAGDPFAGAAEAAFEPSYCESEYTLTLTAKIPQAIVVDASKNAHYNVTDDNGSKGFNHTPTFINALRDFFRTKAAFNEEFPDCMRPGKVALYTREHARAEWYSYIKAGKIIGTATVKFIWNQSTQKLELAGEPSDTTASLTRVFVYRVQLPNGKSVSGNCPDKAKVPMLLAVQPSGNNNEGAGGESSDAEEGEGKGGAPFTLETGLWFPFDAYGATIDPDTPLAERVVDGALEIVKHLFKSGGKLLESYERLPGWSRFLIETGVGLAIGVGEEKAIVGGLTKTADFYKQFSTGTRLTEAELEHLELVGSVKGYTELFGQIPYEAYGIYTGYFGYPVMSAVIRGAIKTAKYLPSAEVSPPRAMPYQTTLGVTVSTTKFPTWSLEISRDALATCLSGCHVATGPLPWYSSVTGQPETFNPFSTDNPPYVVENSAKTSHSYTSGHQAVKNVLDDTTQNAELAFSIRHKGTLATNFAGAQDAVLAPTCDADTGRSNSLQTLCWVFSDWRP